MTQQHIRGFQFCSLSWWLLDAPVYTLTVYSERYAGPFASFCHIPSFVAVMITSLLYIYPGTFNYEKILNILFWSFMGCFLYFFGSGAQKIQIIILYIQSQIPPAEKGISVPKLVLQIQCTRGIWKVMHIHSYNFTQWLEKKDEGISVNVRIWGL